MRTTERFYNSGEVCTLLDVTFRQLDWWCNHGLIHAAVVGNGSGFWRRYTQQDLIRIAAIKRMRDIGLDLDVIREYLDRGEEAVLVGRPLPEQLLEVAS